MTTRDARPGRGWCSRCARLAGCLLLMAGWSGTAEAQTTAPSLIAGTPWRIQFDGATFAEGYRAYVDGVRIGTDLPAPATLTGIQLTLPAVGVGAHTVQVSAFNSTGEGPKTAPLAFTATPPIPAAPTNLTIIVQVAVTPSGTATVTSATVTGAP